MFFSNRSQNAFPYKLVTDLSNVLASMLLVAVSLSACSTAANKAEPTSGQERVDALRKEARDNLSHSKLNEERELTQAEKDWGIEIVGLRTTMAGMMVDLRYKIVDPNKAAPLLDIKKVAYLVVEKSGEKLSVPNSVKIGSLRQTTHEKKVKAGRDYFVLFGNPRGKHVQPGDKVAVVIGDFKTEHLTLQ